MEPKPNAITWSQILALMIAYGPELFMYIMKKVKANGPVTDEELDEVLALIMKPGQDFFRK